ncbi:MAG: filamentous hemagglutinin N-terminal domain-containing protein [Candidatus Marithrix sp.]
MKLQILFLSLIVSLSVTAEITTDGSLGQQINLPGPNFQITPDLGQQHGSNLFHSFQDFNLNSLESATFSGANNVQNILSRVTGGNPSNIDGLIRSTIPNANFYFLNPYGIMFGPNARLDVQGSFHTSTADYLRLGNSGRFAARNINNSLLTIAPVTAFGFLDAPAPITITGYGNVATDTTNLSSNYDLSFIGGQITIKNGTFTTTVDKRGRESAISSPLLSAPNINLIAVNSNGEVTNFDTSSFNQLANVSIQENSLLQGNVTIRGNKFLLDNSSIQANNLIGITNIQAKNVQLNNANLISTTNTAIKASDIKIQTSESINITDSTIKSKNYNSGIGGNVILIANKAVNLTDSTILVNSESQNIDAGKGGNLTIIAKDITISGKSINLGVLGKGDGGNITFTAKNSINLVDNVHVYIDAYLGSGNGGELNFTSKDIVLLDGAFIDGGTKNISGNAGNINIDASGDITIAGASQEGKGRASAIMSGSLPFADGIQGGNGGTITIKANNLLLKDGGLINSNSTAFYNNRSGNAGKIIIQVNEETKLSGVNPYGETEDGFGSGIYAKTIGIGDSNGKSGQIDLQTGSLIIEQGAVIKSDTNSTTKGGDINIIVRDNILITGDATKVILKEAAMHQLLYLSEFAPQNYNKSNSGIYARSNGTVSNSGNSGSINITAKSLTINNNGTISTSSKGGGNAGNIKLLVDQLKLTKGSISSESQFDNISSATMLSKGDVVIVKNVDGKNAYYINVNSGLIRFNPISKVANIEELNQLSKKYVLSNGDIVEVADIGNNQSGRYIYNILYGFLENWVKFDKNDPNSLTFNNKEEIYNYNGWYPPENPPPYAHGQIMNLENGETFVYYTNVDPFTPGYNFGTSLQVNSFNISSLAELEQLKSKSILQNGSLANLNVGGQLSRFFYYDKQWIKFNNTHTVANVGAMNELVKAQVGHVKQNMIYTGERWIPLHNTNKTVNSLEELQSVNNGDLVSVADNTFFYVDGKWIQQVKGGNAGQIELTIIDGINLINNSSITTESISAGGGEINIQVTNLAQIANSKITTSVKEGSGNGGDLTVKNPKFIVLNQGKIIAQANKGNGGNINLVSERIIDSPGSIVSASSKLGIDGEIKIDSPDMDMEGFLVILPGGFVENNNSIRKPCSMRGSSFVVQNLIGSSQTPYDYQAARYLPKNKNEVAAIKNLPEKLAYVNCKRDNIK